jgi:arginyl-tRNA synthetase
MTSETTEKYIESLLQKASKAVFESIPEQLDVSAVFNIDYPDPKFGDYSSNMPMVLAKQLKKNPKELSESIIVEIKKLDASGMFSEISALGGFINFTLSQTYLLTNLQTILEQGDLYGCSISGQGKTIIVEYFQNNVAKPAHVGHLRSAVIGDCLLRVFKSQGYKTISDTHIGDWGVQFGILIYAYKTMGNKAVIEKDPINELNKLYVEMSAKIEADSTLREKGKEEFIKLEKGDTENRELWQWFVRVSLEDFEKYRLLLDVMPFDHNLGESFYEDKMPAVLEELQSKNLITIGETGEQYVDLEKYNLGRCILVKSDGGTTYHLRDFATYIYRKQQFNFYKNIYVVDNRQTHHFNQLFKVLELAGYPTADDSQHVDLGFMSLPEGAISTRKGTTISLQNLIDEANKRALKIINDKNPELANKEAIAKLVALAALKYFDLSHNRKSEIVFTWDKALSFEGNTGPYLQYTHARTYGILRKVASSELRVDTELTTKNTQLTTQESSILRKLIKFPQIIEQVAQDYLPNNLCNYLFELSQSFNSFYQEVPVLQETDEKLKSFRLNLITATAQVISNGLYLLGIEAPEEM